MRISDWSSDVCSSDLFEAFDRAQAPVRDFMLHHVRENDLRLFLDLTETPEVEGPEATPMRALIPAFMISELRRAFEIGFLLFLPFHIIDMVVASILMSMRSEEHTSELQSLMRISYAVFCLKKQNTQ